MTIYLVRHGKAGKRTSRPDDIERPLDDKGCRQAKRVAEALMDADVDNLLTSPAVRCAQTMVPLGDALGLTIEHNDDLWEGAETRRSMSLVRRLAANDINAVLCSHGNVIPDIVGALAREGAQIAGSGCAKGSVWALEVTGGSITEARYRPLS